MHCSPDSLLFSPGLTNHTKGSETTAKPDVATVTGHQKPLTATNNKLATQLPLTESKSGNDRTFWYSDSFTQL